MVVIGLVVAAVVVAPVVSIGFFERMLLNNYYKLLIGRLLNNWLTLKVLMLPASSGIRAAAGTDKKIGQA